jgi:hypothetical protein
VIEEERWARMHTLSKERAGDVPDGRNVEHPLPAIGQVTEQLHRPPAVSKISLAAAEGGDIQEKRSHKIKM